LVLFWYACCESIRPRMRRIYSSSTSQCCQLGFERFFQILRKFGISCDGEESTVTIEGAIVSTADITPTRSGSAWEIFMDTVEIKGSNIPFLRQILDNGLKLKSRDLGTFLEENVNDYTNPKPIFETTYLGNNMRISRDQDGKVFVYGKTSDVTEPTTYSNVDSDMGVTRLLEGINDSIFKFYI